MKILKVKEMHCEKCVERIEKALTGANIKHDISLDNKTVSIEDKETNISEAIEILDDLGFTAVE